MRIDHIGIYVSDLEATKEFFIKYFGAKASELYHNPKKQFKSYFLSLDDGASIEIMTRVGINGHKALGKCHLSINVGPTMQDVDKLTLRLKVDGYQVLDGPRTTGDGYYESCVEGPDGNLIEITADNPDNY